MTEKNKNDLDFEPFTKKYWRSSIAWLYMIICLFDFIIFPIVWAALHYKMHESLVQWQPLTLIAGGLVHLAFGAILGVTAFTRGQENLEKTKQGYSGVDRNRIVPRSSEEYEVTKRG